MLLTAHRIEFKEYSSQLRKHHVPFREVNGWLECGKVIMGGGWELYLTSKTIKTPILLDKVLPTLIHLKVPFKIIKDQELNYKLNGALLGDDLLGKVICIYPQTDELAITVANALLPLTNMHRGPKVNNAIRLGQILYAAFNGEGTRFSQKSPFKIEKEFLPPKRKALSGKGFVLYESLQTTFKGDVYKAINLRRLSCTWCLIKRGNASAVEDQVGRDIMQRLLWEKRVIEDLTDKIPVPRIIDLYEEYEDYYLVMEYVEGELLRTRVETLFRGKTWNNLTNKNKFTLLSYYLEILSIVQTIHELGYVHRDLTDTNFKFSKDDKLYILDFEISYSFTSKQPSPAFIMGTPGYVSPEQMDYAEPKKTEDVYSLGAILLFMITGVTPRVLFNNSKRNVKQELIKLIKERYLVEIAFQCLDRSFIARPTIQSISSEISKIRSLFD
jgi:Protein kinase domain